MDEVAATAGLHVQTLYRHFPSKIDLAAAINHTYFDQFEKSFRAREVKTVPFWRDWVRESVENASAIGIETFRQRLKDRFTMQEMPAAFVEIDSSYEALLANGIAEDISVSLSNDRRPMLIACMLWSSHKQMLKDWAMSRTRRSPAKEAVLVVDAAVELLEMDELVQ